jgi:hypothetical protein
VNTIPTRLARLELVGETLTVFRTARGRLALQRDPGGETIAVFESTDAMVGRVPAELVARVRDVLSASASR